MVPPRQMLLVTFRNSVTAKAQSLHKGFSKDQAEAQVVPKWVIFHFYWKMTGNNSSVRGVCCLFRAEVVSRLVIRWWSRVKLGSGPSPNGSFWNETRLRAGRSAWGSMNIQIQSRSLSMHITLDSAVRWQLLNLEWVCLTCKKTMWAFRGKS